MKKLLIILISVVVLSIGFYNLTLAYLPNFIYNKFYTKATSELDRDVNTVSVLMAPDETSRLVVKPNPDFAYASSFFDLSEGQLRLTGDLPDSTYWSVAFYEPNTINFYVKNDLEFGKSNVDLILSPEEIDSEESEVIVSPTSEGFFLLRLLVPDKSEDSQERMKRYLDSVKLEKYSAGI